MRPSWFASYDVALAYCDQKWGADTQNFDCIEEKRYSGWRRRLDRSQSALSINEVGQDFLSEKNPVLFDLMNSRNLDILLARMEDSRVDVENVERQMKIVRAATGYGMTWSEQVAAFYELEGFEFLAKFLKRCPAVFDPLPEDQWTKLGTIVKGHFATVNELYRTVLKPKFQEALLKDNTGDEGRKLKEKLGRGPIVMGRKWVIIEKTI